MFTQWLRARTISFFLYFFLHFNFMYSIHYVGYFSFVSSTHNFFLVVRFVFFSLSFLFYIQIVSVWISEAHSCSYILFFYYFFFRGFAKDSVLFCCAAAGESYFHYKHIKFYYLKYAIERLILVRYILIMVASAYMHHNFILHTAEEDNETNENKNPFRMAHFRCKLYVETLAKKV